MKSYLQKIFIACMCIISMLHFSSCFLFKQSIAKNIDSAAVYDSYRAHHFDKDVSAGIAMVKLFRSEPVLKDTVTGIPEVLDGEPVPFTASDDCLAYFKTLMNNLGVSEAIPSSPLPAGYLGRLSLSEGFKGDNLINWLVAAQNNGATEIRVCFGRYTPQFLTNRFPTDLRQQLIRRDRITIFLYPYKDVTMLGGAVQQQPVGTKSYDLGNLHP